MLVFKGLVKKLLEATSDDLTDDLPGWLSCLCVSTYIPAKPSGEPHPQPRPRTGRLSRTETRRLPSSLLLLMSQEPRGPDKGREARGPRFFVLGVRRREETQASLARRQTMDETAGSGALRRQTPSPPRVTPWPRAELGSESREKPGRPEEDLEGPGLHCREDATRRAGAAQSHGGGRRPRGAGWGQTDVAPALLVPGRTGSRRSLQDASVACARGRILLGTVPTALGYFSTPRETKGVDCLCSRPPSRML